MSWQPGSSFSGFQPTLPQSGLNLDSMSLWGQPAGAGGISEDALRQVQYDWFRKAPEFRQQELDIARQAAVPPSKWTTGTQTFGTIAQGLSSLANIWMGYQAMKQQKKAFEFNKGVTNTNLNNAITDYNRRLGDTLANRALNNGQGDSWVSSQLAKYSAKRSQ